jgi:hypothetical protein
VVRLDADVGRRSRLLNASERGLMLILPDARPVGTRIHITVYAGEPPARIDVSGVIVHIAPLEAIGPGRPARAGIFLTTAGPDWLALCRSLAAR